MSIVQRIQQHLANPPLTEDGESWEMKPSPSFSADEITTIEKELGYPLPAESRALLEYCRGFEGGALDGFEFWGKDAPYVYPKMLRGRFREIAADGFGNFWFYWKGAGTQDLGPVFYYQHEGPMYFYQCESIVAFVAEWLRFMTPPYESFIDDVHEFRIKPLKEINKDLLMRDAAATGGDEVLREFAKSLDQYSMVYDFRKARVGDGVDLLKWDVIAVHPKWPILAVRPRQTLLGKLKALVTGKSRP